MKKIGMINSEIAAIIAQLGHTDTIVIADCGLPIPEGVRRIDIALRQGTPSFYDVLETVLEELEVEQAIFAEEIKDHNQHVREQAQDLLSHAQVSYVSHEDFKERSKKAKAIIRTGEATPYANVILQSGVCF